jgi:hypothetical protein
VVRGGVEPPTFRFSEGRPHAQRRPARLLHRTRQRCGHLPAHHIDFRSAGDYVLIPPSQVGGEPYERIKTVGGQGHLDWQQVIGIAT